MDKQAQKEQEITTVEHIPERDVEKSLSENKKNGDQSSPSEEELKLVRKLDLRILPIACLLYLFAYLDRSNLGNARLQGLTTDVLGGDPNGQLYGWLVSIFYFPYILLQVPATLLMKLFSPRIWLGLSALGWGITSTLSSSAFNFPGIMVARLFLGVFEACFGPAIPLYLSFFYTKHEMGLRMAYWFGFAAVAGAFGGLIAFGVQHIHSSVSNWRLLFIIEGIPSVLLGISALIFLPDRPEMTKIFNEEERRIAIDRMNRSTSGDTGLTLTKRHIFMALRDWRIYTGGAIYFGANCALASISAFLPTIITTFGYTNATAQLLTVPPYAVSAVVLILVSYVSDKRQTRGYFVAGANILAAVGYVILLAAVDNVHAKYFATFCITSGTYTVIGLVIAWYSHNLGSETKRATGLPMFMGIGHCGSVLGSHIFPTSEEPRYIKGFSICCALLVLGVICSLVLYTSYRYDNHSRDKKYGKPEAGAKVDTSDLADKAPEFRYLP
ncbi:MFS general substrate transporter [Pyrrhoderma noxium]|uniref:MFS general substrate transporter n=1 Tax=Pyrrhoderma noxium TaxID=2282107 RepID=A0A286U6B7_9AGAM|nr:MFS general substrate transporter [Pyrrhoderma noxium]